MHTVINVYQNIRALIDQIGVDRLIFAQTVNDKKHLDNNSQCYWPDMDTQ